MSRLNGFGCVRETVCYDLETLQARRNTRIESKRPFYPTVSIALPGALDATGSSNVSAAKNGGPQGNLDRPGLLTMKQASTRPAILIPTRRCKIDTDGNANSDTNRECFTLNSN